MKKLLSLLLLLLLTLAISCKNEVAQTTDQKAEPSQQAAVPAENVAGISGKVIETMDASGYTYAQVDTGSEKVWVAGPKTALKVGDEVSMPKGSPIQNFKSKTLDREFEQIFFVSSISTGGADQVFAQSAMPGAQSAEEKPVISFDGIEKPVDGQTIAEIFQSKSDLGGKGVMLRGKVVKSMNNIMGKNWLHIQDGTGGMGTNDLTVTTAEKAKVGDTVLVSGVLTLDKDFGSGYRYDLIIEDAKVTVE